MNEQQLKEAFMQYLQQKSGAQTQQEFEAYVQQLGEEGLQQEYMQFMQLLQQQQVASRKFGGMLNYIEKLRGICPEGYEMQFFKQGGQICKKCVQKARMQNGGDFPEDNPVEAFKKKHQLKAQMDRFKQQKDKKVNWPKNAVEGKNVKSNTPTLPPYEKTGSPTPLPKDSNNIKPVKKDKCGSKMKKKARGGLIERKQPGGNLPTAQSAKERYRGASVLGSVLNYSTPNYSDITTRIVQPGFITTPDWEIGETITQVKPFEPDTTYYETPRSLFVKTKGRSASSKGHVFRKREYPQGRQEYETLKRRFNEAKSVAKKK